MHSKTSPTLGIMWFVLHCLLFAFISIITKILMQQGLHVFEIVFFQAAIGSLFLLPRIIMRHREGIKALPYKMHIGRAVLWALATICFFYATTKIPMGRAIAISFAVPLFTTILAVFFLKEKLHARRITALICGFIGMLVIIKPGFESFEAASFLVVVASFMWSVTDIMIKLVGKTHHAFVNTFYFSIFSALCTLPLALFEWQVPNAGQMAWLGILAFLFVFNMVSITKAYEHAELTIMMPFVFSELVFVAALAYMAFGEVIHISTAIGSIIIVASTSYISYRERKEHGHFLAQEMAKEMGKKI